MRRILVALAVLHLSLPAWSAPAEHVILVSIDGLRPEFYLAGERPMPLLRHMARAGVHAREVFTVFPSVTYPSHTTMVTGVRPDRHGIHYNSPFEPAGATGGWYWEHELIEVETLWTALRRAGRTSAAVSWPVTVGAPIDFNVPEIWSLDRDAPLSAPLRETATPVGLIDELEAHVGRFDAENWSLDYFERDLMAARLAAQLLEQRPAVLAVHLVDADHFQHEVGREGLAVERSLAAVDTALSVIHDAVERFGMADRTAWVITGDHGFIDTHTSLAPNVWLAEAGIAVDRSGDWEAVFHGAAAAMFLHLADPTDEATVDRVRAVLDDLPASVRSLFEVLDRDELAALGAAPDAALGLAPADGVRMTGRIDGEAIRPARGGTHGYLPDLPGNATGFVGYGAGFREGISVPRMNLVDVYPLVAHLLGLEIDEVEGLLLPGLLEPGR